MTFPHVAFSKLRDVLHAEVKNTSWGQILTSLLIGYVTLGKKYVLSLSSCLRFFTPKVEMTPTSQGLCETGP